MLRQQQQPARRASRESRDALAALRRESERMRRTPGESQVLSPAAGSDAAIPLLREDRQAIASVRVAIAEYYRTTGRMPARQSDAGLPPPERYRGRTLTSAAVLPDGSIELAFDAASGVDGGRIRFVADVPRADAMGVQ